MSGIKVSESEFWEVWPKVKDQFFILPGGSMRTTNGHCPITAVASLLGANLPGKCPSGFLGDVVRLSAFGTLPQWAEKVAAVADGDFDAYPAVALRLVMG